MFSQFRLAQKGLSSSLVLLSYGEVVTPEGVVVSGVVVVGVAVPGVAVPRVVVSGVAVPGVAVPGYPMLDGLDISLPL